MVQYWLCSTSYANWEVCLDKALWGVKDQGAPAFNINQLKSVNVNDIFIFYVVKKGIIGYFKVSSEIFREYEQIWLDDIYPNRIKLKSVKVLNLRDVIPFNKLKNNISNLQSNQKISDGASIYGKPMIPLFEKDGEFLIKLIEDASNREKSVNP
jgi:predicted RNA-binding protein